MIGIGTLFIAPTMFGEFNPHLNAHLFNHKGQFEPSVKIEVVKGDHAINKAATAILILSNEEKIEKAVDDIVPNKKLISLPGGYEITSNDVIAKSAVIALALQEAKNKNSNGKITTDQITGVAKDQLYEFARAQVVAAARTKIIDPVLHKVVHAVQIPHAVKHHKYFALVSYVADRSVTYALVKGYDWTFDTALKLVKK